MTTNITALILNTNQELQSFPLNQSIKIKFSEQIEDSQLYNCIALIRHISETGLFNISEKYNQSIGYIREKFDTEDIKISTSMEDGFVVTITPSKPLSPGFAYTLFIDKNLSSEFLAVSKTVSKSSSVMETIVTSATDADINVEIVSDPKITSTTNIINLSVTDNILNKTTPFFLDLKKATTLKITENITVKFGSTIYIRGEVFSILTTLSKALEDNLFVQFQTSLTSNVKPIDTEQNFKSVSNADILAYYKTGSTENSNPAAPVNEPVKIEYAGINKFVINLPSTILVSDLDLTTFTYNVSEAFNIYTLEMYKLYDPLKEYDIQLTPTSDHTILVTIKEVLAP